MKLIDTNVLSYVYNKTNNYELSIDNEYISSVVASEFLLMQKKDYYIPNIGNIAKNPYLSKFTKVEHLPNKHSTDSILFDFNQLHDSFCHYSNFAISDLINNQNIILYDKIMEFQDKTDRKELKKKIRFIIDNNIKCEPILDEDIKEGYLILEKFIDKYSTKGNFRNTWNDILILSKSINKGLLLITEDKLLNKIAMEFYNAIVTKNNDFVNLTFNTIEEPIRKINKESKGYINKSWEYKIRNQF